MLPIYENDIISNYSLALEALKKVGLRSKEDELEEKALTKLKEKGNWENISSSVSSAYLESAAEIIKNHYKNLEVKYVECGLASWFTIDGEEVYI